MKDGRNATNTNTHNTTKIKITNYTICNAKNLIINTKPSKHSEYRVTSGGISKFTQSDTTTEALTETCSGINVINIAPKEKRPASQNKTKSINFTTTALKNNFTSEGRDLKITEGVTNRVNLMRLYDKSVSRSGVKISKSKNI